MQQFPGSGSLGRRVIAAGAALWLGVTLVLPAQAPAKKYAVLVGVNAYQHARLPALSYAVNDVTALAEVLQKAGYDVALLCDTTGKRDAQAAPTKANIEKQLKTTLQKCRKGDTVFLAFAGHGLQFDGQKDSFFCPSDARPFADRTDSLVSLGKIYEELDASFAGVKIMLVDACRNDPRGGRGTRGVDADSAPRPPRGVAALFSCSAGQTAFEDDRLKHGVFFHFVLQGLRGEAKDSDGEVTFGSLSNYVCKQVAREVPKMYGKDTQQSPNLKADLSGESPVLVRVMDGRVVWRRDRGYWKHKNGNDWFEVNRDQTYNFKEVRRTKDFIELERVDVNFRVRLYDDRVEGKGGNDSDFKLISNGKWDEYTPITPPSVPSSDPRSDAPFAHIAIFYLKKDAPKDAAKTMAADAYELLTKIPSVRSVKAGPPADQGTPRLAVTDYQVGLLVLFDNADGLKTYLEHPLHLKYLGRHENNFDKVLAYDFTGQSNLPLDAPFVHAVIFYLKKDAPKDAAKTMTADAQELLTKIPSVRSVKIGPPSDKGTPGLAATDYQLGLLLLFDNADGLKTYLEHPLHVKFHEGHRKNYEKVLVYDFINQSK